MKVYKNGFMNMTNIDNDEMVTINANSLRKILESNDDYTRLQAICLEQVNTIERLKAKQTELYDLNDTMYQEHINNKDIIKAQNKEIEALKDSLNITTHRAKKADVLEDKLVISIALREYQKASAMGKTRMEIIL